MHLAPSLACSIVSNRTDMSPTLQLRPRYILPCVSRPCERFRRHWSAGPTKTKRPHSRTKATATSNQCNSRTFQKKRRCQTRNN